MYCPFKVGDIIEFNQSLGYIHLVTDVTNISEYFNFKAYPLNEEFLNNYTNLEYAYQESDILITSIFRED